METETKHEHKWQPNGQTRVKDYTKSPCSVYDDVIYTKVYSCMVCECGATDMVHIANEDVHRRGDRS